MSNFETCSINLAPAPETPYSTTESAHKLLKRCEIPAVEPKITKNKTIGAVNPAAVSANAWPSPTPEATVSRLHDASTAVGRTWNWVLSHLPQWHPQKVHRNRPIPGTCVLDGDGKILQKPVKFICPTSAAHSLTVAIDGGGPASGSAISMPADPEAHGPSNGPLGSTPDMFHVAPLGTTSVKPPQLFSILLPTVVLVFIACALIEARNFKLCKVFVSGQFCPVAFFLATGCIFNRLASQTIFRAVANR
ncbi:hypothetical protein B0H13DRAFT_1882391 [Mycena leptocephala]|nr:hypothetical protein B0H13DRAFT_1882391 [Mycena leptocephala]